jgi:hypothetical protein
MTDSPAQQRDAAAQPLPRAATALLAQLDGWTHTITHATGPCTFGGLSEDTDGEGKRHCVEVVEDVASVCLRAHHSDGRRLNALWIKRKSWTLDTAFRWPWPWEHGVPLGLTATELTAYVTQPPPPDPREAEQLARDLAELAQHRARWEANRDVWVPIPMRWSCVRPEMTLLRPDGREWMVMSATRTPSGTLVRARRGEQEFFGVPPEPTALVLVPVPERDALTLSRDVLGSRIMSSEERRAS